MGREIKFKGKSKDGEWVHGYLFQDEDGAFIKKPLRSHRYGSGIEVDPDTICQFTGLYDRDGNEVWEDSILEDSGNRFFVYWTEGSFNIQLVGGEDWECTVIDSADTEQLKVIGNRFDNKELLNE